MQPLRRSEACSACSFDERSYEAPSAALKAGTCLADRYNNIEELYKDMYPDMEPPDVVHLKAAGNLDGYDDNGINAAGYSKKSDKDNIQKRT